MQKKQKGNSSYRENTMAKETNISSGIFKDKEIGMFACEMKTESNNIISNVDSTFRTVDTNVLTLNNISSHKLAGFTMTRSFKEASLPNSYNYQQILCIFFIDSTYSCN